MNAAVFIDVQNDFLKGGALPFAYPEEDNSKLILDYARECRSKGYAMFATADTHRKTTTQDPMMYEDGLYSYKHTLEGKRLPIEHCIENTEGHKILEGLVKDEDRNVIIPQKHIIDKHLFGTFNLAYEIDSYFSVIGEPLEKIFIVGYCTSICVVSNALILRAKFPNTEIVVWDNLCGDINKISHDAAIQVMKNCQIDVAYWTK